MAGLAVVRDLCLGVSRQQFGGGGARRLREGIAGGLSGQRFQGPREVVGGGLGDVAVAVLVKLDAREVPLPGVGEIRRDGVLQPAPAPRFSRSEPEVGLSPRPLGADSDAVLGDWGFDAAEIAELRGAGIIGALAEER